MRSDELNISKELIYQTLLEDLWKKMICAKFIPHWLMEPEVRKTHILPRLYSDLS
jgi:hypothetical protein